MYIFFNSKIFAINYSYSVVLTSTVYLNKYNWLFLTCLFLRCISSVKSVFKKKENNLMFIIDYTFLSKIYLEN